MFSGRESPWSVLEVDGATATQRDVKRAYAKLLKKFRPDTDPEGFRRIHDAYQTVLTELELRESGGVPEPPASLLGKPSAFPVPAPGPADVPAPAPDQELPSPFLAAAAILRGARTSGDHRPVPDALIQLRLVCGEDPALWLAWSKTLTEILDQSPDEAGLVSLIDAGDVLCELRAGAMAVATQVLHHWQREGKIAAMVSVGKVLTAKNAVSAFDHTAAGFFALRLAFRLAIAQPGGANLLLDAAFAWLPPQARSPLLPAVENRLNLGRLFWHLPPRWHQHWEYVFDELSGSRTVDWESVRARSALADLMQLTPSDWPGWGFLQSVLPPYEWEKVIRFYHHRPRAGRRWNPPPKGWTSPGPDGRSGSTKAGGKGTPALNWFKQTEEDTWKLEEVDGGTFTQGSESPEGESKTSSRTGQGALPPSRRMSGSGRKPAEDDLWQIDESDDGMRSKTGRSSQASPAGPPPSRPISDAERVPVSKKRRSSAPPRRGTLRQIWRHTRTTNKIAFGCLLLPIALLIFIRLTGLAVMEFMRDKSPSPESTIGMPEHAKRIDWYLKESPRLRMELDEFLKAGRTRQLDIIQSTGQPGSDNGYRMRLLACAILHPAVSLDLKQKAVEKIEKHAPPPHAVEFLNTALVPGSPAGPAIINAMHRILRDHERELPVDVCRDLKRFEEEWQKRSLEAEKNGLFRGKDGL